MNKQNKEGLTLKGIYYFTKAKIQTKEQWQLTKQINELRNQRKEFMPLVRKLNLICKTEKMVFENIIPTCARTMLTNNLTSTTPTNDLLVDYIALGTNNTAVANTDTTLGTETYRNSVASKTNSTNTGYVSGFFNATECDDTYYEAGIFCDATSATDNGILLSHVLIDAPSGVVKSNVTTLTVDWTIQIN